MRRALGSYEDAGLIAQRHGAPSPTCALRTPMQLQSPPPHWMLAFPAQGLFLEHSIHSGFGSHITTSRRPS